MNITLRKIVQFASIALLLSPATLFAQPQVLPGGISGTIKWASNLKDSPDQLGKNLLTGAEPDDAHLLVHIVVQVFKPAKSAGSLTLDRLVPITGPVVTFGKVKRGSDSGLFHFKTPREVSYTITKVPLGIDLTVGVKPKIGGGHYDPTPDPLKTTELGAGNRFLTKDFRYVAPR